MKLMPLVRTGALATLVSAAPVSKIFSQVAKDSTSFTKPLTEAADTTLKPSWFSVIAKRTMEESMGEQRNSYDFGIRNKIIQWRFKPDSAQAANNLPGRNFASITNEFTGIELVEKSGVVPRVKISTKLEGNQMAINPNTTLCYDLINVSELKFKPSVVIPAKGVNEPSTKTPSKPIFNNFLGFTASVKNNDGEWGAYLSAGPEWSPHLGENQNLMPKVQAGFMKRIMENMYLFLTGSFKGVAGDKAAEKSIQAGFLFNTMR